MTQSVSPFQTQFSYLSFFVKVFPILATILAWSQSNTPYKVGALSHRWQAWMMICDGSTNRITLLTTFSPTDLNSIPNVWTFANRLLCR